MNKCRNPECGKEIREGLNYCNENCLRKHQEIKKIAKELDSMKTAPMSNEKTTNIIFNVEQALFAMTDKAFQKGLVWRMKQAQAVRSLIANGWKEEQILREFRHNGMTEPTARKIIEDAIC